MFAARRALCAPIIGVRQISTSSVRLAVVPRASYTRPIPTAPKTAAGAATNTPSQATPDIVDEPVLPPDEIQVEKIERVRAPISVRSNVPASETALAFAGEALPEPTTDPTGTDWYTSYHGLSVQPFSKEIAETLMAPIDPMDVEIKPGKLV